MATFKAKGIVLRETGAGESDKILTVLFKERGRLSVSAKGAKKSGSKFLPAAQLFAYCDYVIYAGAGFYSLASAVLIDNFFGVSADYDKFVAGSYLLELTGKSIYEGVNCDEILYLLLVSLKALEKGTHAPETVKCAYGLRFLALNGYEPETKVCAECGGELGETLYFGEYGTLCGGCRENAVLISPGCLKALEFILNCELKNIFSFKAERKIISELITCFGIFFAAHAEVSPKSGKL